MPALLDAYRLLVALDEPFVPPALASAEEVSQLVMRSVQDLLTEAPLAALAQRSTSFAHLQPRDQLKTLLTLRPPEPFLSTDFHTSVDRILHYEQSHRPTIDALLLPTIRNTYPETGWEAASLYTLWQGDVTTLQVDAIVNAANATLLGCFQPFHACIDNAIHSVAGPRLREDCQRIMALQETDEPTGIAKITRGYHLPAAFVLHTVGPIYRQTGSQPSRKDKAALASSYQACLDLAAQIPSIRSLAFCCISTGVFGFPQQPAAEVALSTVNRCLREHPGRFDRIVFTVFKDHDREIYQDLLARLASSTFTGGNPS